MNPYIILTTMMAATAGLLFGFDTGNIAGALIFITKEFHTSILQNEIIVSVTVLGAFFSAFCSSKMVDVYGRRNLLIVAALLFIIGAGWGSFSYHILSLIGARLLLGIAIGISSYTAPLYISEIAPAKYRGGLVLLNGIAITSGEAMAYLVDYYLAPSQNWRMMIFMGCIPGLVLLTGMLFMPCSPRWLMLRTKRQYALDVLKKIRGHDNVHDELEEIQKSASIPKSGFKILFSKQLRRLLIIGIGLGILQQFFGINTIMYYGPFIFKQAGFEGNSAEILATFGMGVVNVIMTIVTGLVVDRFGRRNLLILGSLIAGTSLLIVSYLFHHTIHTAWQSNLLLISMMTFIIGYCISVGSLFWLIIAEIFPLHARSSAMGFATSIQWLANFVVSMSFLSLLNKFGTDFTFGFYASMCFVALLFTYYLVPETKGLTLEKIEAQMRWKGKVRATSPAVT